MKSSKGTKKGARSTTKRKTHRAKPGRSEKELLRAKQALERRTAELALSLSMMQATLDSTTDAIVVTDLEGNVRDFNEKYAHMMGVTREQLQRANVNKLRRRFAQRFKDPEGFMSRVKEIYATTPAKSFETLELKDGGILERYSQIQLLDQRPVGRVWSFRDVTERKRGEEKLEAAKTAAENASQAKDDFLAVLSHELRTPLTPALIAVSHMAEQEDLSPDIREDVIAIWRNVQLEAQLIDDLLDITRIARGKIEMHRATVDVHTLLRNAFQIVENDIEEKKILLQTDLAAAHHHISADSVRIQQVFWNLINNAVKFTPAGGRIDIRSFNEGSHFVFEVSDTGIGIEPERQNEIFEAFHQGERSITRRFGGLGLGLTISKALLDLHGGSIGVQSRGKNQGTTFRVALELLSDPVLPSLNKVSPDVATTRSLRLLLVDDHADTRRILTRLLTKGGHDVSTTDSAQSALKLLDDRRFDALISDIGLPGENGYYLVREARRRQTLKAVALSGFGTDADVQRSLEAGFDYHLTKPVDFNGLRSILQKLSI